ncbi:MAG TPA: DUF3048 domain-containing protein [Acidimicrobiales bacterium]|nr:DUF3048 domain-containing protein [Acidimicrobiales bacterium]
MSAGGRFRSVALLGAFALAFAGCSCGAEKPTPVTAPASTTPETTTTTVPKPTIVAPLTGAPTTDLAAAGRPALVVKIDNADPPARPQLGLNQADVVYEERVEGSVTRFAAVFQSTQSDPVGPIRSARLTDIPIISALTRPLFAWSGANPGVTRAVRAAPVVDIGPDVAGDAYERRGVGGKVAPHNFYSSTAKLWAHAPADAQPPAPIFQFRMAGDGRGAGARKIREVHVDFGVTRGAPVDWRWDANRNGFARWQRGTPHVDERGTQVAPRNVIVQFVEYRRNGDVDVGGSPVYVAEQIGSGACWVLTDSHLIEGTWTKTSNEAITTFTDTKGNPIKLNPGRTWVELSAPGGARVVH